MSCELPEECLKILEILHKHRNFTSSSGYHSEKLKKIYTKKFSGRGYIPFKDAIKQLLNEGYITIISKKEDKYFISNSKKAAFALLSHGSITSEGLRY